MPAPPIAPQLLAELAQLALLTASGAAEVLSGYSVTALKEVGTKSSPTDMVSEADRASEAYIVGALRRERPDDSLLGEEGARFEGNSGVAWLADPLDGTTNFLYGIPAYGISLAATYNGQLVTGAVVNPVTGEKWWAAKGKGAWQDGSPCHVAEGRSDLSTALVATGFGYQPELRAQQAELLPRLLPVVRDIRRFGSAALDLCWVASGRYDAYYESNLNDWDWAAGRLICEEAGGKVTMLPGNMLLATTPSLSEPLARLLRGLS